MRRVRTLEDAADLIPDHSRVFIGSASGVPSGLVTALAKSPRQRQLTLIAGYLVRPLPLQRPDYRVVSLQPSPALWRSVADAAALPVRYSDYETIFRPGSRFALDVALVQVSRPGPDGRYSLGTSVGGALPAIRAASLVIAQVNEHMPYTFGDGELADSAFDVLVDADEPLAEVSARAASAADCRIAELVAPLVPEEACIQLGVGSLPQQIGRRLAERAGVTVRSGMVSDWCRDLRCAAPRSILTAEVLGSAGLYQWVHRNPLVYTAAASRTHVADSPVPLFAINSALEIDLSGAVNAEVAARRVLSGPGGLPDFSALAQRSPGGVSIVMLPATSPDRSRSSVVKSIPAAHPVTLPGWLADVFVTDVGVASVRQLTDAERRTAIAGIAAPAFRAELLG
jgi:acyl-CoA hydrolase